MIKTISTRVRGEHSPLTLSESFADVAEVLAPVFDTDERFLDEPMGELVWLPRRFSALPGGAA